MQGKARNYRLSPLAKKDLEDIWLYTYSNWSIEQADKYHNDIINVFDELLSGNKSGLSVDVREGYLKYPIGSHFIFYRNSNTDIEVIRILHQSMDIDRYL